MGNSIILLLCCAVALWFCYRWITKIAKKDENLVAKILNEYGLTIPELTGYNCKYVGGHPDQNWEVAPVLIGAKNGKLIFFQGATLIYKEEDLPPNRSLMRPNPIFKPVFSTLLKAEGPIRITSNGFKHLFDIPIGSITDIQYVDETTTSIKGGIGTSIGGIGVGVPIRTKDESASVFIVWVEGNFSHSTELCITQQNANARANALRNVLIKMVNSKK